MSESRAGARDGALASERAKLREAVRRAGLERHESTLLSLARPAVRLVAENPALRAADYGAASGERSSASELLEASQAIAWRTRLGGVPLADEGFRWPRRTRTRERYGFLVQEGTPLTLWRR